jgi:hypothetical protein
MSHVVGFGFQAPSMPLLMVSPPLPLPKLLPAEALLFDGRGLGLRPHMGGRSGAVALPEGVAAGNQGHGFFVVHAHAGEGLAHIAARGHRVGVAVGAFGVHIDQPHLHGGQRVFQLTVAAVALVAPAIRLRIPSRCPLQAARCPHGRRRSRRS